MQKRRHENSVKTGLKKGFRERNRVKERAMGGKNN